MTVQCIILQAWLQKIYKSTIPSDATIVGSTENTYIVENGTALYTSEFYESYIQDTNAGTGTFVFKLTEKEQYLVFILRICKIQVILLTNKIFFITQVENNWIISALLISQNYIWVYKQINYKL